MKRVNKVLTEAERQQKEERATYNRRCSGYKRTVISLCESMSLRTVKLQLEFLEGQPTTQLPKEYFSHADTVAIYKEAIMEYEHRLAEGYYQHEK